MTRQDFECLTKPLYDGLREFAENSRVKWLVRDVENEFWVWNEDKIASVRQNGAELVGFSSHGTSIALKTGEDAFEFVIGVFSAANEEPG